MGELDFDIGIPDVPEPEGGIPMPGGLDVNLPPTQDTGGGPGFGDIAKAVKGGFEDVAGAVKPLLPFASLATAGMGIASGVQGVKTSAADQKIRREALGLQRQVAGQQQAAAAPLTQFGQQELASASAGKIPPAIQSQIDVWARGAKQKAADFAARSGQGDSMMLQEWMSWIDQQAQAMAANYLQEQQRIGISSLTAGAQALGGPGASAGNVQQGAANESAAI